jgi:hypothetical protein
MRKKLMIGIAALIAGAVLLLGAFLTVSAVTGNHTLRSVTYAQVPPHSGDHSPVVQRCGFYAEPVRDEHAVHSLEHGVVWITYRPDIPPEQIEVLRAFALAQDDRLVSPYLDAPAPVMISVWGRQASLDVVDADRLENAVRDIRSGPEAPEPGAGCDGPNLWLTGATGDPET